MRFHNRKSRSGNSFSQTSRILLDKFVKHLAPDGALVVRAPFSIQLKGSFFDERFNVNREKNIRMLRQYQDQHSHAETPDSPKSTSETSAEKGQELKKLTTLMSEHFSNAIAASKNKEDSLEEDTIGQSVEETSPLHILIYGQEGHRLDSYSVVNSTNQHHVSLTSQIEVHDY